MLPNTTRIRQELVPSLFETIFIFVQNLSGTTTNFVLFFMNALFLFQYGDLSAP
jgi:hypothetical protein